ncbi:hypothetical protein D3C81_1225430 [compost metagenome]
MLESLGNTHAKISVSSVGVKLTKWHFVLNNDLAHFIYKIDHVVKRDMVIHYDCMLFARLTGIRYRVVFLRSHNDLCIVHLIKGPVNN